jgi:hypothetical protein
MKRRIPGRNLPFRISILLLIVTLAVACGKGGGDVLAPSPVLQNNESGLKGSGRPVLALASDDFRAVEPGDVFTVELRVSEVDDLYQFVTRLTYDPALVAPVDVKEGGFLTGETLFVGTSRESGVIPIAGTLVYEGRGAGGNGTLATITFTKIADSEWNVPAVSFTDNPDYLKLVDSVGKPIDFSLDRESSR